MPETGVALGRDLDMLGHLPLVLVPAMCSLRVETRRLGWDKQDNP